MAASDEDSFRAVTSAEERGERIAIEQEIDELRRFKALASGIRENAKGNSLLTALARAFAELERLGAAKKAIIFTESKRTQTYLLELLADTPNGDRSEEHTSELQSLMRISYAVFCLKKN